jgi:hypothetical protein
MSTTTGGLNIYATQKTIKTYLQGALPWPVLGGEIPDAYNVRMVNGEVDSYAVVRFSDLLKASGQDSFGGPRQDGYYGLVQVISVAATDDEVLELASMVNNVMIGHVPDANSGPITKDFGGGSYDIKGVNSQPSFLVAITAFRFLTNMEPNT